MNVCFPLTIVRLLIWKNWSKFLSVHSNVAVYKRVYWSWCNLSDTQLLFSWFPLQSWGPNPPNDIMNAEWLNDNFMFFQEGRMLASRLFWRMMINKLPLVVGWPRTVIPWLFIGQNSSEEDIQGWHIYPKTCIEELWLNVMRTTELF